MKKNLKLQLLTCIILLSLASMPVAFAGSSGDSTGTAHVIPAEPVITNLELWDMMESVDKNNTALTVNTEYHVNFTVSHASTLTYLDNITINIWNSGGAIGENDSSAQRSRYQFTWVESTGIWSCPLSESYIIQTNCSDPGAESELTTYEFRLAFKLSKVANYANGETKDGWLIKVYAFDEAPKEDAEQQLQFGVAGYFEISVTEGPHVWSDLIPGTSKNVTTDDGDIDFTVIANTQWKAQVEADGPLADNGNMIALANLLVHKDDKDLAVAMTDEYADVLGLTDQSPPTDEGSAIPAALMLWLTVPNGTPPGDYTYILYIQIVIHS